MTDRSHRAARLSDQAAALIPESKLRAAQCSGSWRVEERQSDGNWVYIPWADYGIHELIGPFATEWDARIAIVAHNERIHTFP